MDVSSFVKEVQSIQNPTNRDAFLSKLIDKNMTHLEEVYRKKSEEYMDTIKDEIKNSDPLTLVRKLKKMSRTQTKLFLILENLVKDDQI